LKILKNYEKFYKIIAKKIFILYKKVFSKHI
jgi:hypothetical protein